MMTSETIKLFIFYLSVCGSTLAASERGDVIIQLFQWPYVEVGKECASLGLGVRAVQVAAPQEHRIIHKPLDDRNVRRPWWERYQPVSFQLGTTRGGTLVDFQQMVTDCKTAGIDVYVEILLNHLAARNSGTGIGSAGTWYSFEGGKYRYGLNQTTGQLGSPPENQPVVIAEKDPCLDVLPYPALDIPSEDPSEKSDPYGCDPKLAYSTVGVPMAKLDLTNQWVIDKHRANVAELVGMGVKGFCIVSASFSKAEELAALFEKPENRTDITVYAELMDLEKGTALKSFVEQNIVLFSLPFAQQMGKSLRHGPGTGDGDESSDHLPALVPTLLAHVREHDGGSMIPSVTSFEFTDQLHLQSGLQEKAFSIDYASVKRLESEAYRESAYFFLLLLSQPSFGIPRIVSHYNARVGKEWQGPPIRNPVFEIRPPDSPDQPGAEPAWKSDHRQRFIKQLITLRRRIFWENRVTDVGSNDNDYTLLHSAGSLAIAPAASSVILHVLHKVNKLSSPDSATTCRVLFTLVGSHQSPSDDPQMDFSIPAATHSFTYEGKYSVDKAPTPNQQQVCGAAVTSDQEFALSDCVTLTVQIDSKPIEDCEEEDCNAYATTFTVVVPSLSSEKQPRTIAFWQEPAKASDLCGSEES